MNIKTGNGMGLDPKGIAWKPNYGMGLKMGKGMGLKPSNGMGLSKDQNYFKFNEYERKRKYLQMGSHKPSEPKQNTNNTARNNNNNKAKNTTNNNSNRPNTPVKATAAKEPEATTKFQARQKWGAAAAAVSAAAAFNQIPSKKADKYKAEKADKTAASPESQGLLRDGQSVGSVKRTMSLFEQLLYV